MNQSAIYRLHQNQTHGKYKKEMLELVWGHSLIVKNIAIEIAEKMEKDYGCKIDRKLVEIGALLHDIGVYDYFDDDFNIGGKYILHGRTGYEILIKAGVSKKRARFSLVHIGVGYENDIPVTVEEEIVAYSDNFHSKIPVRFNSYEGEKKHLEGFGLNKGVLFERFKDKYGLPDLKNLEKKYKKWQEEFNEWMKEAHSTLL